jgi:carbonic anhydrase
MLASVVLAVSLGVVSANPAMYAQQGADWTKGMCASGMMQSPIDLTTMTAEVHAPIQFRNYFNGHFNKFFKGAMINTGHAVVWNINPDDHFKLHGGKMWKWHNPSIRDGPFGGKTHTHAYYLWKADFHWGEPGNPNKGSEHTIDGTQYPLEMQMVHIEDKFVAKDGTVDLKAAKDSAHGFAILSILFYIDPTKPQNQEPLSAVDDKVWEMHWPGAHSKRSLDFSMDLKDVEEQQMERDHELNMRQLQFGFSQLKVADDAKDTRAPHQMRIKMTLNVGAFIRKVVRNGADKTMSTYWTYMGSLTTPSCKEAVTWVVFQRLLPIAQVQANAFSSLYCNNYREARPAAAEHNVQHLIHNCLNCECQCYA